MKLHITKEQLSELGIDKNNYPVRLKLDSWCMEKDYFIPHVDADELYRVGGVLCRMGDPLLSIGQMIEFLVENDIKKTGVSLYFLDGQSSTCSDINEFSLCDDLWDEVKEVLNA